jgi:hypothetical protein
VLAAVERFNTDPDVHGILVQLPVRTAQQAHTETHGSPVSAHTTRCGLDAAAAAPARGSVPKHAWRGRAGAAGRYPERCTRRTAPRADHPRLAFSARPGPQMPKHIDEEAVLSAISLEKDVDGFHPLNIGRLAMKGREPLFVPCTPKARCALRTCGDDVALTHPFAPGVLGAA